MTVIHKRPDDWRVTPNFTDYEGTRARFAWQDAPDVCEGMDGGGCNIAFAALDRHAHGAAATSATSSPTVPRIVAGCAIASIPPRCALFIVTTCKTQAMAIISTKWRM